jgi:glycoprotein endo-alpha-1,2-mannosidase
VLSRRAVAAGLGAQGLVGAWPRACSGSDRAPKAVLAFYYGWYGAPVLSGDWRHWRGFTPRGARQSPAVDTPLLGFYDSHDPAVVARHADWISAAGLTGVICSWWGAGSFEDRSLDLLCDVMHSRGLGVTAYVERQERGLAGAEEDLRRLVDRHASHPAWLQVHGRPVFFLYVRALLDLTLSAWRTAADRVETSGRPRPFLVADLSPRQVDLFRAGLPFVDGVHNYIPAPYIAGLPPDRVSRWARATYPVWRRMAADKLFCLTVVPGFDDTLIAGRPAPRPTVARQQGQIFSVLWEEAIRAGPDWILITSWNEWHEGSEIEPSREYGDAYLQANARFARRFRTGAS